MVPKAARQDWFSEFFQNEKENGDKEVGEEKYQNVNYSRNPHKRTYIFR